MDENTFDRNLKAMDKWYPLFSEKIRKEDYELDEIEIIKEVSMDKEYIYRIKTEEAFLYLNGKRNAKQPMDTWSQRLGKIHKYAPVFLLGLGSGMYLKRLIADTDSTVAVIVYEPSLSIFLKTLKEIDLVKEIENRPVIFVVEGLNGTVFEAVIGRVLSFENVEFLKVEIHPGYQGLYLEKIVEKTKGIEKRYRDIIIGQNSNLSFTTYLVRNQMMNMRYICDGYHTKCMVKTVPYSGPAILVAAGPSLNKNIQELKMAKNKAFILAVDTAVKPLINAGIKPDAFCTIDPKKPLNLVEIDAVKDIPIIASPTANAEIIERQRGKKIFYADSHWLAEMVYSAAGKILPVVASGGSVACTCFSLLYKLGFDTIILIGQDLAYTDNKSHADGTFENVMPEEATEGMIRVKGNYEDTVPTLSNLKAYLEWFEMYIKGVKEHRNVRVINATEGGAYIEGTELMTLHDAIKETCVGEDIDFRACIDEIESEFNQEERKKAIEYLHTIPRQLEDIKQQARKLYFIYHKLFMMSKIGKMHSADYKKCLKKVKKISRKCEAIAAYQLVASSMAAGEFIVKAESLYELDTIEEEAKAVAKQGMKYANLLQGCSEILKEYAEEILLEIH